MLYRVHLAWAGFELTTLVVIGTDCIGSYKSSYIFVPNDQDGPQSRNIIHMVIGYLPYILTFLCLMVQITITSNVASSIFLLLAWWAQFNFQGYIFSVTYGRSVIFFGYFYFLQK